MKKYINNYKVNLFVGFIFIVIFSVRLTALTSDLPNWGVGQYQAPDEGSYAYLALNQKNYGQINPDFDKSEDFNQFTAPHLRGNILGSIATYVCMQIFGDNYIGFRMASFIFMLINLILIFNILNIMSKNFNEGHEKLGYYIKYVITFILLLDFTFTLASKVVETSIYRLFCILMCLYIYIKLKDSGKIRFLLLGFISVFSVCGIYITNLFLVISVSLTVLIYGVKNIRKRYSALIFYFSGGVIAFVLCELYYRIFWRTTFLKNTFDTLQNFGDVEEYSQASSVYYFFKRGLLFLASNFNVYNIAIFLFFLMVFPLILIRLWEKKEEFLILNLALYFSLFCQTLYSEDYILRKYLLVAPSMLFLCFFGMTRIFKIKEYLNKPVYKMIYSLYIFLVSILCLFNLFYRFYWNSDGSLYDYSQNDFRLFLYGGSIIIIFISSIGILFIWIQKIKLLKLLAVSGIASSIIFNGHLNINYIYFHKTYSDKNIMKSLKDYTSEDNKTYILGDYMLSYSLYNNIIPVVNDYDEMFLDMIDTGWYLFGYSTNWNITFGNSMKNALQKNGYDFKMIKEFPRIQTTFGEQRNMALYKAVKTKR